MIRDRQQLRLAEDALGDLYEALIALKASVGSDTSTFAVLAEGPIKEIRRIQAEVDEFTGLAVAEHEAVPMWLRLVGQKARWGETPASVLAAFLDSFRKGVQSIAAFNSLSSVGGRPPNELKRACDIELVGFSPGSFQVGLRFPEPDQLELFPTGYWEHARIALAEFVKVAKWAASGSTPEELSRLFQDTTKRRVVLRAFKPFVPRRNGGIDFLELSGSQISKQHPIRISQATHDILVPAVDGALDPAEEVYEGEIREMDLDRRTFWLRSVQGVKGVHCEFDDNIVPAAKEYLGTRVRVIGIRTDARNRKLKLVDLERIED